MGWGPPPTPAERQPRSIPLVDTGRPETRFILVLLILMNVHIVVVVGLGRPAGLFSAVLVAVAIGPLLRLVTAWALRPLVSHVRAATGLGHRDARLVAGFIEFLDQHGAPRTVGATGAGPSRVKTSLACIAFGVVVAVPLLLSVFDIRTDRGRAARERACRAELSSWLTFIYYPENSLADVRYEFGPRSRQYLIVANASNDYRRSYVALGPDGASDLAYSRIEAGCEALGADYVPGHGPRE